MLGVPVEVPALAAGPVSSACSGALLPGAEKLWDNRQTRWIIVGEQHGTAETPAAFGDLVCQAIKAKPKRQIVVALEYPQSDQAVYDRYFKSAGRAADRDALLRTAIWQSRFKDGRTSIAMLDLLERLRVLRQRGAIAGVVLFQPSGGPLGGQAEREVEMARILQSAATSPNSIVLALVGNVHAMRGAFVRPGVSFMPAAGHLPDQNTISLDARGNGGAAWNCAPECGVHDRGPSRTEAARGVVLDAALRPSFDGLLNLGAPTTASPPVS